MTEQPRVEDGKNGPYCLYYRKDLTPEMMEKKRCLEKACRYFAYTRTIVRWP